ncbi:hypothetical protein GCM10008934_12950 [Virgibacillus salarius]
MLQLQALKKNYITMELLLANTANFRTYYFFKWHAKLRIKLKRIRRCFHE